MSKAEISTLAAIHAAALEEFSNKGFKSASLRNIVKIAGVTTGAFYGYYDSKEKLFEALVGEHYEHIMTLYRNAHKEFNKIPYEHQPDSVGELSGDCMREILLYSYEHLAEVKLILSRSDGTRFSEMIDEMADIEVRATHEYLKTLERLGRPSPPIDARLEHILITGMFNAFFELILHEMPIEQAMAYYDELQAFYTAGWLKIMGQ